MLVMCQCLFITSLVIDNKRLQVTEKGFIYGERNYVGSDRITDFQKC